MKSDTDMSNQTSKYYNKSC